MWKRERYPRIREMADQTMAIIYTEQNPEEKTRHFGAERLHEWMLALRRELRTSRKPVFRMPNLRARWPGVDDEPQIQWVELCGFPIPNDLAVPKKAPVKVWEYGTVAEIVHVGRYSDEGPTIDRLHKFIDESGYRISGCREKEYLTGLPVPDGGIFSRRKKTITRYPVQPK